jgi:hypothetical protein
MTPNAVLRDRHYSLTLQSVINQFPNQNDLVSPFGIDPRPASASRALLRLSPCHQAYLRPYKNVETSGTPGSLDLTGGEYKTRERIHRGMLIRDY